MRSPQTAQTPHSPLRPITRSETTDFNGAPTMDTVKRVGCGLLRNIEVRGVGCVGVCGGWGLRALVCGIWSVLDVCFWCSDSLSPREVIGVVILVVH